MALIGSFRGTPITNSTIDTLTADFSGMVNLNRVVDSVLQKLILRENVMNNRRAVAQGKLSVAEFDGWFAPIVRAELGKVLAIVRNKAVKKAREAGAGSAATAVLRRMYRGSYMGNINIASSRGRISSRERVVEPPNGGVSGIRRQRTVKKRTEQLRKYYGPDRGFILRILEEGRDEYMAKSDGPIGRGSKSTHGRRGAIAPRNWFYHSIKSDMELAAQELGTSLVGYVETWINQNFTETEK